MTKAYPAAVIRRYARDEVFRRDSARMLVLGYRIMSVDRNREDATGPMKVTYLRPEGDTPIAESGDSLQPM